jgi:hypothetical protein
MSASWSKLKTCYLKFGTKQIKFRNQCKFLSKCSVHQYRPFCSVCRQVHNQIAPEFAIKTLSRQKSNSSSAGSDQVVIYAYLNWTKSVLIETLLLLMQYWNNNIPSGEWKFRVASKIHFILAGLASNSCKASRNMKTLATITGYSFKIS